MLSGLKVPTGLRTDIGRYMRRWGYWEENQFPAAERQLARFPQAQWKVTTVTAGELTAEVHRNQTWTRVCVGYIRTPNKNHGMGQLVHLYSLGGSDLSGHQQSFCRVSAPFCN